MKMCLPLLVVVTMMTVTAANGNQINPGQSQLNSNTIAARHEYFVGITAWAEEPIYYEEEEIIIFSGVLLNEGGSYSPVTGQFTVGIGGVYYVVVSLKRTAEPDEELRIKVYKDAEEILATYNEYETNAGISVSNSVLVVCSVGEVIYMKGWGTGSVYGHTTVPYSTFSVMLMQQSDLQHQGDFVGFSAAKAVTQSYLSGDTVQFSRVLYNGGNHFLPAVNRFLCPQTGIYYISVNHQKDLNNSMYLCVSKSTQPFIDSADTDEANVWSTATNTALTRCEENETISVQGTRPGRVSGSQMELTTFTAMKLHATQAAGSSHTSLIAFSMYKKTIQAYAAGDTISFDGVLINDGNNFLANRFVCPTSGIYYVSLNAKKAGRSPLSLDVVLEAVTVFRVESIEANNPGSTISGSALVSCLSNEVMRVKGAGVGAVYGDHAEKHTAFSVFIMHQYSQSISEDANDGNSILYSNENGHVRL